MSDWRTGDAFVTTPDGRYGMQLRMSAPGDAFPTSKVMSDDQFAEWRRRDQKGRTELEIEILFDDPVR